MALVFLWGLYALCTMAAASDVVEPLRNLPPLLRSVSDEVGALSPEEGRRLARELEDLQRATDVRIIVVLAETTRPESVEEYTERLARAWEQNRGIDLAKSIFVVIPVQDRQLRVSAGSALQDVQRALEGPSMTGDLPALFRERQYFEALRRLTARFRAVLTTPRQRS